MKVLITGGAGFIGSHIAEHCIEVGHSVFIADNLSSGRQENIPPAAQFHHVDIGEDEFSSIFTQVQPDAVIHMAAQINVASSISAPVFDAEANILNTIRLLELCVQQGTKRFIFASSAAVYGHSTTIPVDESCLCEPLSPYGVSKLSCESYIQFYARQYDISYAILRNSNVYGPRQIAQGECGVCAVFTELMMENKTPTLYGNGTPQRDYVYVSDVAKAYICALNVNDNILANISAGQGIRTKTIYDHLKILTNFESDAHLAPLRDGEIQDIYLSNNRAKSQLNWSPEVILQDGLEKTVKHFRTV